MSTVIISNQAPGAAGSYTSSYVNWAHNIVVQVSCVNGMTGPLTAPVAQLWISPSTGLPAIYYLADTRSFSSAANTTSYHVFNFADYAGTRPLVGNSNCLQSMPYLWGNPQVLAYWKVTVTSGQRNGSTFNGTYN